MSGGVSISGNVMLSTISGVGTDTNPIFLVRRVTNVQPELIKANAEGITELYQDWELAMDQLGRIMPTNSSNAINECIELAKKCANVAEKITRFCSNIISEHQYLHQGWLAVIANLDDNINRIQRRLDKSMAQAEKLDTIRHKGRSLLTGFDKTLETLQKIVIPPSLISPLNSSSANSPTANLSAYEEGSFEELTLFDWISSKDPAYSLNSLSQHVLDHLEKTDDASLKEAQEKLELVQDVAQKSQYRMIGGIDKRLAMLNTNLQKLEESLAEVRETVKAITQPKIKDSTQNVVHWQKEKLDELKVKVNNQHKVIADLFINSKDEVMRNICQRLATWIRQAYQRLHDVNKRVMCFEEKFTGLRQRLDLARQIKEAPSIYMAAVPEVMRREKLKKEFALWMNAHISKTMSFIEEENKIRLQFYGKLERHFLRQLFNGMNDTIPQFTPQISPSIDVALPRVPISHLHELRQAFPEMKELLSVGDSRLFSRLSITDRSFQPDEDNQSRASPSPNSGGGRMRREESFYVRDKTSNIDAMNQNFPSTNWLNETGMEMGHSPYGGGGGSTFMAMARDSNISTSTASLHSFNSMELQSPKELGPLSEQFSLTSSTNTVVPEINRGSLSPLQPSAPIAIPSTTQSSNPVEHSDSLCSNQFSTPEDTFGSLDSNSGSKFVNVRQAISTHQTLFHCSPKITRPTSILRSQGYPQMIHREEDEKHLNSSDEYKMNSGTPQTHHSTNTNLNPAILTILTNTHKELAGLSEELSSLRRYNVELRDMTLFDEKIIKRQINEYLQSKCEAMLKEQQQNLEEKYTQEKERVRQELQKEIDDNRSAVLDQERKLKERDAMIASLNEELASIRQERDLLLQEAKKQDESIIKCKGDEGEQSTQPANESDALLSLAVSCTTIEEITKEAAILTPPAATNSDEDDGVARLSSRSCGTQTKIRSKDLQSFVSLNEVYEGCGALIIWNPHFNAYAARSTATPNSPYIVKDSSFERLGIRRPPRPIQSGDTNLQSSMQTKPRPWMFVYVESIELCQIRKATNRYNLPLETRFYRISVVPMPGEFVNQSTSMSTSSVKCHPSMSPTSSVCSSKR